MRPLELLKSYRKTIFLALGVVAICIAVVWGAHAFGSSINEHRIDKLETEKQQALKERDAARANDLILQGKIEAKDEVIKSLTSQIAESNERVVNAHNETQTARITVSKVRADKPHFNSADDAGRINELRSGLEELYRDTP
jgi:UDP-N-acetyl-D-mannosaminuronate dehydrogenase